MKINKRVLTHAILWPVVAIASIVAGFIIYSELTDYKPALVENILASGEGQHNAVPTDTSLVFYTWNIGYCGLGKEMDFVYEGGKMVRPTKELAKKYREGVVYQLTTLDRPDFILLQEVDSLAKRSYNDNQCKRIALSFPQFTSAYAINHNVKYFPLPLFHALGKVVSGQLSLSRYQPEESVRYAYPSSYRWPKSLFMPHRCFILSRFKTTNGKQLILINLHNSASDDALKMREKEMNPLKDLMIKEFAKGNYVIAGGDWNQNPLPFDSTSVIKENQAYCIRPGIAEHFLPANWEWAYDPDVPTNRNVDKPYHKGQTPVTTLDFFVLSPNIELRFVQTIESGFNYSDHQPVGMVVKLK